MADFKYEIVKHIGVLSESGKGWTKELNVISWNGANPKYDIRDWAPDHEKMGKGITLTEEEAAKLRELLGLESCWSEQPVEVWFRLLRYAESLMGYGYEKNTDCHRYAE